MSRLSIARRIPTIPTCWSACLDFIAAEAQKRPIVFPLHPRTLAAAGRAGLDPARTGIRVIEPVGYLDMCRLLHHAAVVLTDSGGVQKEAYFHRVPCITLRDETEWTETIDSGWNRLWTSDGYRERREIPDYGDGNAAPEIVAVMRRALEHDHRVNPKRGTRFRPCGDRARCSTSGSRPRTPQRL